MDDMIRPGSVYSSAADTVIERQNELNNLNRHAWESAKLKNLSVRQLFQDSGDALSSGFEDLLGNSQKLPLSALLTRDNRLRGVGFLLAITSATFLLITTVSE